MGEFETHPDYGRAMLNIPTMDPSLAFVDLDGHLIAQYRLPERHHQLSIRHMAIGADGAIWSVLNGRAIRWRRRRSSAARHSKRG